MKRTFFRAIVTGSYLTLCMVSAANASQIAFSDFAVDGDNSRTAVAAAKSEVVPPVIIEVENHVSEWHWVIGRQTLDLPFKETGAAFGWKDIDNGHLKSTTASSYISAGRVSLGTHRSIENIEYDYEANCGICPWTGMRVSHQAKFWVNRLPGTPITIYRFGEGSLDDTGSTSTSGQRPTLQYDARTSFEPWPIIPVNPPPPGRTTVRGPSEISPEDAQSIFGVNARATDEIRFFDGKLYSLALVVSEVIDIDWNLGAYQKARLKAVADITSKTQVKLNEGLLPIPVVPELPPLLTALSLGPDMETEPLTIDINSTMHLTSSSFDPDDGNIPGAGVWGDEWVLETPSGNELVFYGSQIDLPFTEYGAHVLRYRVVDDEANSAGLFTRILVVPEPANSALLLAGLAFAINGRRRQYWLIDRGPQ